LSKLPVAAIKERLLEKAHDVCQFGDSLWRGGVVMRTGGKRDVSWMRSKLLAGLSDEALRQLLDTARVRHIAPRKNVIIRGEQPDHLLLLKTGRTRAYTLTESGSEIVLMWVAPGGVLGLVSLLATPPPYLTNATTVTASDFLVWDHDTIRELVTTHPQTMENGLWASLDSALYDVDVPLHVCPEIVERKPETLIQLATSAGEVGNSGIKIDITNEQLGSLSDIGYFTTSRILSKWEQNGMLSKQRGRVTLLAPETLMAA